MWRCISTHSCSQNEAYVADAVTFWPPYIRGSVFVFTFLRFCFLKVACTGEVELLVANGERNDLCAVNDFCKFSVHGTARSNSRFQVTPWCKLHRRSSGTLHSVYSCRLFGTTYRRLEDGTDRLYRLVGNYKRCVTSQKSDDVSTKL